MIYKFNAKLIKILASYFVAIDKLIPKFIGRGKRLTIAKIILKKNKFRGLTLSDSNFYYKALVMWYWRKNRQIDQWYKIKSPEINPHKYKQLIFDKGARAIQ